MVYEVPDVTVKQVFETQTPNLSIPTLNLCLVGTLNQIEDSLEADAYNRGTALTFPYPSLRDGAIVDQASVSVYLQNDFGKFLVSDSNLTITDANITIDASVNLERSLLDTVATTGKSDGIFLEDANVDFINALVRPGISEITITNPAGNTGTYIISDIISSNKVRVYDASGAPSIKSGTFGSTLNGSIISAADIAVVSTPLSTSSAFSDNAVSDTVIARSGIGASTISGDFLRVTAANPAGFIGWENLSVASVANALGEASVIISHTGTWDVAVAPFELEDPAPGDLMVISGSAGSDGTYIVKTLTKDTALNESTVVLTTETPISESGGGISANIHDISRGAAGNGTPGASTDYKIVAVLSDDSIQISSQGLLSTIDGTDMLRSGVAVSNITGDNGSGFGEITLAETIVGIAPADIIHLSGTAAVSNNNSFVVASVTGAVITVTVALTDDPGGLGTADIQDVTSTRVDTFEVLRVIQEAIPSQNRSGDFLDVTSGSALGQYEIIGVTPNKITLNSSLLGSAVSGDTFSFARGIPFKSLNNTYDIKSVESNNFNASVLVSYEAKRRDLTNVLTPILDYDDMVSKLGNAVPGNPLAMACDVALRSTNNVVFVLGMDNDTIADHQSALGTLESEEVYCIVPLTQDIDNIALYPTHCSIMSEPSEKRERICLLNREIFIQRQVFPVNDSPVYPTDGASDVTGKIFTSATAYFDTAGVKQGDDLEIMVGGVVASTARVLSVTNDTTIELLDSLDPSLTNQTYRVQSHPLSKYDQAGFIATYANAMSNRRAFLIWPPEVDVTFASGGSNVTEKVPGFYAAAGVGGMITEYQPQQPFTNVPMSGINELYFSNKYFRPSLLDRLAEGGVYILAQSNVESPVYCRHQLSTNTDSLEFQELSITKAIDYSAKYIRDSLRPFIGKYNITENYIAMIKKVVNSILADLIENGQAMPGTNIRLIEQDIDRPDTVNIGIDFKVPYPSNYIRVTLYI